MALEDKTEQATPQHRQESRKKGQVARSTDVTSAFVLLAGLMAVRAAGPSMSGQLASAMARFLGQSSSLAVSPEGVRALFVDAAMVFFRVTGPLLGAVALAGVVGNVAQVGFMFATQPLAPDFNRMNPVAGLGRMFSARSAVELAKSVLKVAVVGWVVWAFLRNEQNTVISLGVVDPSQATRLAGDLVWRLCMRACTVLVVIASADYLYQRFQFEKSIRMTKQEVKEEFKRSEGDPLVKSQFRQRHRQMAMQRMMQDIPKADVVVTNPTHIAVALRYDSAKMAAPVVVAKGKRLIAERIKQIAKENRVPLVENKPVARALYKMADVGHPVPVDLYQAVAEILAFVYRLRHGARPA
jgi:flagellar biosynthetic protein FlhB